MASQCVSKSMTVAHVVPSKAANKNISSRSVIKAKLPKSEFSATFSSNVAIASRRATVQVTSAVADAEEPKETKPARSNKREVTVKPEEVVVGATFKGTVTAVQAYGAFVNFGAKNDGLVHISQLSEGFVSDVNEVVSKGQEVDVRVISTDNGKYSLSMKPEGSSAPASGGKVEMGEDGKPVRGRVATRRRKDGGNKKPALPASVKKNGKYQGVVKTIMGFGAFVELKVEEGTEGVQGLLHISEISDKRIEDVNEVLSVDQEVEVRVASIEAGGKLNLTMKEQIDVAALNAAANANVGPSFSVIELALKQAGVSREQFPDAPAEEEASESAGAA